MRAPLQLCLIAWASFALASRAPGDTRPNIITYFPDTIRAESLSAYGHPLAKTPNVDRLAASGILFEQAHVQHSQCTPSRCALLSAWRPLRAALPQTAPPPPPHTPATCT